MSAGRRLGIVLYSAVIVMFWTMGVWLGGRQDDGKFTGKSSTNGGRAASRTVGLLHHRVAHADLTSGQSVHFDVDAVGCTPSFSMRPVDLACGRLSSRLRAIGWPHTALR